MRKSINFTTFQECQKISPRAWRVVLVCTHSILVSVVINETNRQLLAICEALLFKVKNKVLLNLDIAMKKKLVLLQSLLRKYIYLGAQLAG